MAGSTFIRDIMVPVLNDLRSNLTTDPFSRSAGFVMNSWPERSVKYPVVTVNLTGDSSSFQGLQSEDCFREANLVVNVFGRSPKERDEISDDVIKRINELRFLAAGSPYYAFDGRIVQVVDNDFEGKTGVHVKTVEYSWNVLMEV